MTRFQIENTRTAIVLGQYEAVTEQEALDLLAIDAGYVSYSYAQEVAPAADGEIRVTRCR